MYEKLPDPSTDEIYRPLKGQLDQAIVANLNGNYQKCVNKTNLAIRYFNENRETTNGNHEITNKNHELATNALDGRNSFRYASKTGYFVIDNKRYDAIDILASDPVELGGTDDVTFYGYIGYFVDEADRSRVTRGFRFDTTINPGEITGSYVTSDMKLDIDAVFMGTPVGEGGSDDLWRRERREVVKFLITAAELSAAVRVTGEFKTFRNSFNLYFEAKGFEVLETKP
jgi:hypothetical protein